MVYQKKQLAAGVALAGVLIAPLAVAQSGALEEVVVTAQKREQSLQDTPVAISAFDAHALDKQGIDGVFDVGHFAPNVQIVETPSSGTGASISMRGAVTFNPAITWEPPVGLYLDGVFIGKNLGSIFDIVDLERVEVLRGPQGTLYGKNTVGGAINLITRKPSGEFGGKLTGNIGNENLYSVSASVDTPAVDVAGGSLMANIGLFTKERDGFTDNVADPFGNPMAGSPPSSDFKSLNTDAGRLSVLWEGDAVDVSYSFDYSDSKNTPPLPQLTHVAPGSPVEDLLKPYLESENERADAISSDQSWYENSKIWGHALDINWDAGDWGVMGDVSLRSITAYRKLDWEDIIDIDGSPIDLFHSERGNIDYKQLSQEFQLIGTTERTNYVLGLYYFEEEADVINPISFFARLGMPTWNNEYGLDNDTIAAFGQIDWRPEWAWASDRLTLSFGARWTREEKDQYIYHPDADPVIPYTTGDDKWNNVSPAFIASWELTDEINVYGKVSQGWKSGGFNGESTDRESFLKSYDPEEITSYELGMKSRWLDNRLQLNMAAFENKLKDMQFSVFTGGGGASSTVDNAGKATIRGFELELLAQPVEELIISANYGYVDPKYDEFIDVDPFTGEVGNLKDSRDFPYTAKNTASIGIDYTVGNFDWGMLSARLDWVYNDEYVPYVNPEQNATSQIDSYDLLNARVTLSEIPLGNSGQTLQVAAWGKNLTNEHYRTSTIPFVDLWTVSYFGEPRTYGLELSYQF